MGLRAKSVKMHEFPQEYFFICIVSIKTSVYNLEDSRYSVNPSCLPSRHEEFAIAELIGFHFEAGNPPLLLGFYFSYYVLQNSVTFITNIDPPMLYFLGYTQMTSAFGLTFLALMTQTFGVV